MPLARKAISFLSDSFVSILTTVFEAFFHAGVVFQRDHLQQEILTQIKYFLDGFRLMQASLKHSIFTYDCPGGTCEIPGKSTLL